MRREATVAARQRILAVGFNPRMGTMRTNTSRSDRSTQFSWHGDLNLEAFLPCQSVTHVLNQKCNLCSDPYPVPGYRSSFIRHQTSPLCGYQLRLRRSTRASPARPSRAVEEGSGTAVNVSVHSTFAMLVSELKKATPFSGAKTKVSAKFPSTQD